jgi:hypothetical protein
MEKTAVEWLVEQLNSTMGLISFVPNCDKEYKESILSVINQALQMEKQQIINAYIDGYSVPENLGDSEQYYQETYKSK